MLVDCITTIYHKYKPPPILASDPASGVAWKVDIKTGAATVAANDTASTAVLRLNNETLVNLGVNKPKVQDGYVYCTNSGNVIV